MSKRTDFVLDTRGDREPVKSREERGSMVSLSLSQDKTCSVVLYPLELVNQVMGAASKYTVAIVQS